MQDPLNHFIRKYHWKGILVEPVKEYFSALKETYANEKGLVFENSAITDRKAKQKIFKIKTGTKNIATWYQGIASFDKNNLLSHDYGFPKINDHIEEQLVNCITLQNLIDRHKVSKIDLLCVDVEGYEAIILRQLSKLSIKPKVVFYEHKHLSKDDNQACQKILNSLGYKLSKNIFNTDTLGYLS
jgi:FkbM family methyltransferase